MLIKRKLIESFLPVFTGFYSTIFEASEDNIIESPYKWDDYEFDYAGYHIAMAKACVNAIEKELKPLNIKVTYQSLSSPKYYNFTNDSINVRYRLGKDSANLLNEYLLKNYDAFTIYIKDHFTSYDGFMSWYSNNVSDWLNTKEYTNEKLHLTFGTMLEFYFENEGYNQEDLYYACDGVYLDGTLKEGIGGTKEKIIEYALDNYTSKGIETIVIELTQYFDKENIDYEFLTYGYIENLVKEAFEGIAQKTGNLFAKY